MKLHYLHHDTDCGDGLELFHTEAELKAVQIELMEEARDNHGEKPDYDDEEVFFEAWSEFADDATRNQNYYFADSIEVEGICHINQPELKL